MSVRPSWLAGTAGAQALWPAVGRYAHEHGCAVEAAEALALAAGAPGPRPARVHAVAGLGFLSWDRSRARAHLEQARAGGEELLADIGLAELAVPDGDRQPVGAVYSVTVVDLVSSAGAGWAKFGIRLR